MFLFGSVVIHVDSTMSRPASAASSASSHGRTLPAIVAHILSYLEGNKGTLQTCIRVNTVVCAEAAKLLYRRVQVTSAYDAKLPPGSQVPVRQIRARLQASIRTERLA